MFAPPQLINRLNRGIPPVSPSLIYTEGTSIATIDRKTIDMQKTEKGGCLLKNSMCLLTFQTWFEVKW